MEDETRAYSKEYSQAERDFVAKEAKNEASKDARRSVIDQFHTEQAHLIEQDKEWTDIQQLAEKHNVAMVNTIKPYGQLGPFRPYDKEEFKFVRLFDSLLRKDLLVSGSSVSQGNTRTNLYGSWGTILGEGTIEEAFHHDATTTLNEGKMKSAFQSRLEHVRPSEKVKFAIESNKPYYNELGIRAKAISGIYITPDNRDTLTSGPFLDLVTSLNIPFYLVKDGQFYQIQDPMNIDAASIVSEPIQPRDIVKTVFKPTPEQEERIVASLVENVYIPPRNAISSGLKRAEFVYEEAIAGELDPRKRTIKTKEFIRTQQLHAKEDEKLSAKVYSGTSLNRFGDLAKASGEGELANDAYTSSSGLITREQYESLVARVDPESENLKVLPLDIKTYMETGELPDYIKY